MPIQRRSLIALASLLAVPMSSAVGPLLGCHGSGIRSAAGLASVTLAGGSHINAGQDGGACELDLDFGDVPLGQTLSAPVDLANTGSAALDLLSVTPPIDSQFVVGLTVPQSVAVSSSVPVPISFAPFKTGSASSRLVIFNDSSDCPQFTLGLSGNGVVVELTAAPDPLDFGVVSVDTVSSGTVTLTNTSNTALTLQAPALLGTSAPFFTVTNPPTTLSPKTATRVNVTFSPQIPGQASVSLGFRTTSGQSAQVTLVGQAVSSALLISPNPVEFGFGSVGQTQTQTLTLRNLSNAPIGITSDSSPFDTQGVFSLGPPSSDIPATLAGGQVLTLPIRFDPTAPLEYSGSLGFSTSELGNPNPKVALHGYGGGPQLSCAPASVDFGLQTVNSTIPRQVVCTNSGTQLSPPVNLRVSSVSASPAVFTAGIDANTPMPATGFAPGDSFSLDVSYRPLMANTDKGTLTLNTNAGSGVATTIPLSGQALDLSPCQFAVGPSSLDFGNLGAGGSESLSFAIFNTGSDACLLSGFALTQVGGAFSLSSPPTQTVQLAAHGQQLITVAFSPVQNGIYSGEVHFQVSNPSSPNQTVALAGTAEPSCLSVTPPSLNFGEVGISSSGKLCSSASRNFTVYNACPTPVTLLSLSIQSGPSDAIPQFNPPIGPPLPVVLQPGDTGVSFSVNFEPSSFGNKTGEVIIENANDSTHVLVGLQGDSVDTTSEADTFVIALPKADILFVLDVDDDPDEDVATAGAMNNFIAGASNIDYRIGVTTDDVCGVTGSEMGHLDPCPGCSLNGPIATIISPTSSPDPGTALTQLMNSVPNGWRLGPGWGLCNGLSGEFGPGDEQFFITVQMALQVGAQPGVDFFRPGAFFGVVANNGDNEDDFSPLPPSFYSNYFLSYFGGPGQFSYNYINPSNINDLPAHMTAMLKATNGFGINTGDPNWPTELSNVWSSAISAHAYYPLTSTPSNPNQISLTRNGQAEPQYSGAVSNWSYLASQNAIAFNPLTLPDVGDKIVVAYPIGCP